MGLDANGRIAMEMKRGGVYCNQIRELGGNRPCREGRERALQQKWTERAWMRVAMLQNVATEREGGSIANRAERAENECCNRNGTEWTWMRVATLQNVATERKGGSVAIGIEA